MEVRELSRLRGIISFFDGDKYIIFSTYYGIVAYSTSIKRSDDYKKVTIDFNITAWIGYWNLGGIIKRGVTKAEKKYCEDKEVNINFNVIGTTSKSGENISDKYYLKITMEKR